MDHAAGRQRIRSLLIRPVYNQWVIIMIKQTRRRAFGSLIFVLVLAVAALVFLFGIKSDILPGMTELKEKILTPKHEPASTSLRTTLARPFVSAKVATRSNGYHRLA